MNFAVLLGATGGVWVNSNVSMGDGLQYKNCLKFTVIVVSLFLNFPKGFFCIKITHFCGIVSNFVSLSCFSVDIFFFSPGTMTMIIMTGQMIPNLNYIFWNDQMQWNKNRAWSYDAIIIFSTFSSIFGHIFFFQATVLLPLYSAPPLW